MQGFLKGWPVLTTLAALALAGGRASADDLYNKKPVKGDAVAMPRPAEVISLAVHPAQVRLKGTDDSAQLIVTGKLAAREQDLSGDVKYEVSNPAVVRVTTAGRVIPLANGTAEITAVYGDKKAGLSVTTESCDVNLPINFTNQVVPIFTKLGCNS